MESGSGLKVDRGTKSAFVEVALVWAAAECVARQTVHFATSVGFEW